MPTLISLGRHVSTSGLTAGESCTKGCKNPGSVYVSVPVSAALPLTVGVKSCQAVGVR